MAVKEIRESFDVVGLSNEHGKALREFANALENPVIGKNGKTYVEVPEPGKLIPFLKNMVQRALKAIDLIKNVTKNTRDKIEKTGLSIKERLAEAKARANQYNHEVNRVKRNDRLEQYQDEYKHSSR